MHGGLCPLDWAPMCPFSVDEDLIGFQPPACTLAGAFGTLPLTKKRTCPQDFVFALQGGAVFSDGMASFTSCTFTSNTAVRQRTHALMARSLKPMMRWMPISAHGETSKQACSTPATQLLLKDFHKACMQQCRRHFIRAYNVHVRHQC